MHLLLTWIILWSPLVFAEEAPLCIFGNPERDFHARAAAGLNVEEGSFLEAYHKTRVQQLCEPYAFVADSLNNLVSGRSQLLFGLRKECIQETMSHIHEIQLTRRMVCQNDDSNFSASKQNRGKTKSQDICVTEDMASYTAYALNKGLSCVNKIADHPIDPEIFLAKIVNESKGGYYLQNAGGIGIGQLTSVAMDEMVNRSGRKYLERALEDPACSDFHKVLDRPVEFSERTRNGKVLKDRFGFPQLTVKVCQLVNPQNGLARNVFFSLAHYVHKRDSAGFSIGRHMRKEGFVGEGFATKVNYLSLEAYGAGGDTSALATFTSMWIQKGTEYFEKMSAEKLIEAIRAKSPAVEQQMYRDRPVSEGSVLTVPDIIEYLNEKHGRFFKHEMIKEKGISALKTMDNREFLDLAMVYGEYLKKTHKSYDNLLGRLGYEKGKGQCFAPAIL